jgi:Trypsin-co-occurring domain 2
MDSVENLMPLREFVAGLRSELQAAHEDAQANQSANAPRFIVGPVKVEFTVAAKKEAGAKGGVRLYVFELGASGSVASQSTQQVSLTLTPQTKDGARWDISDRSMTSMPE